MWAQLSRVLFSSFLETLYMVGMSSTISFICGIPLGVFLHVTAKGEILERPKVIGVLSAVVNAARSTPFIILMVLLIPVTRMIVGTSIGINAAVVPLAVAAIPFVGRIVEGALKEVDRGVVEAAQSMGATPRQIIGKVLLPEALPAIISGLTLAVINLIGYSAMAGAVGGGGLGDLAIRYGYQRFRMDIMFATVVILIAMVQICQGLGDRMAGKARKS
jgi:D-methionine transport system permease protein